MRIQSDDLIDLNGIAERSGVPRNTVGVWYHRGKISAVRDDLRIGPLFLWSKVEKEIAAM